MATMKLKEGLAWKREGAWEDKRCMFGKASRLLGIT